MCDVHNMHSRTAAVNQEGLAMCLGHWQNRSWPNSALEATQVNVLPAACAGYVRRATEGHPPLCESPTQRQDRRGVPQYPSGVHAAQVLCELCPSSARTLHELPAYMQ